MTGRCFFIISDYFRYLVCLRTNPIIFIFLYLALIICQTLTVLGPNNIIIIKKYKILRKSSKTPKFNKIRKYLHMFTTDKVFIIRVTASYTIGTFYPHIQICSCRTSLLRSRCIFGSLSYSNCNRFNNSLCKSLYDCLSYSLYCCFSFLSSVTTNSSLF